MLFNSFSFLVFFPVVLITYYVLPYRVRPFFLLLASCFFYMAFVPKYILILFFLITVDYFLGKAIEGAKGRKRRVYLVVSILSNIGVLFFFKYFNFFNENVAQLAHFLDWNYSPLLLSIFLPLGLSFHVFQSLSYVIEVYRGKVPAERNYFTYALYVMFFPQLVAGPIERPGHLLPQFKAPHHFDRVNVVRGLERMGWGFFKKLVIANNIAPMVTHLYAQPSLEGPQVLLLAALFAYQLYADFSGYSDIAIGAARTLGYDLTENFNRPFASRSITEFWRRWHISLSNWIRDYLYYPLVLGGTPHSALRLYASLFFTFVAIGLWHGAAWTYVLFGVLHGTYLVIGSGTLSWRKRIFEALHVTRFPRLYHASQVLFTFALVMVTLIFFRAHNVEQGIDLVGSIPIDLTKLFDVSYIRYDLLTLDHLGASKSILIIVVSAVIIMEIVQYLQARKGTFYILESQGHAVRIALRYALVFATLVFGYFAAITFIYFQF